jgi:hypothetical protein
MTSELKKQPHYLNMPVSYIAVVGSQTAAGSKGVFHFRMSLVYTNSAGMEMSIRFDINLSYTDMYHPFRGLLLVEFKPYGGSHDVRPTPFNVGVRQATQ